MTSPHDLVSAVIPTRHRPDLVTRAVRSALAQTHPAIEVIVVIDGPDPVSRGRLAAIRDPRLTVIELARNHGAAEARNQGVRAARGDWIAFLDDDDEWLPGKVSRQLAGLPSGVALPVMSCHCRVETARGVYIWPRRPALPGEDIAEYLFVRHGLFKGETFAPTTTLMAPRRLVLEHPIPVSPFDDWEWLLDIAEVPGTALATVPETLAVHYAETGQTTLSTLRGIDRALAWAEAIRPRISRRAYAGLLLQTLGGEAAARAPSVRRRLLGEAFAHGRPSAAGLVTFLIHSAAPVGIRRWLRCLLFGRGAPPRSATETETRA